MSSNIHVFCEHIKLFSDNAPLTFFCNLFVTGIAGLAVTYGINLNVLQASVIWNICNAENKMISVERILQYTHIASEAPLVIEDCKPPSNWPETGTICFKNLQVRDSKNTNNNIFLSITWVSKSRSIFLYFFYYPQ